MGKNLVLPKDFVELDNEEMSYVDGGRFFGITVSASTTTAMWNMVSGAFFNKDLSNKTVGQFAKLGMQSSPAFVVAFAATKVKLSAALAVIPVLGWVAIGFVGVSSLAIAGGILHAGSQGREFRIGFNLRTRFGIPTGISSVGF